MSLLVNPNPTHDEVINNESSLVCATYSASDSSFIRNNSVRNWSLD